MKTLITVITFFLMINTYAENTPSIDKEPVRLVMRKNSSGFKKCYDDELKNSPNIEGKVVLDWDISDTGEVKRASIKSSALNNPNVENCMLSTLRTLKFPEAPKGTDANINYPILFGKNK